MCRTEHHILAWTDTGTGEGYIEIRLLCIASGVSSVFHVYDTRTVTLGCLRTHETIVLLCIDVLYKAFLRLEVKRHIVALIPVVAYIEDRSAERSTESVFASFRTYKAGVQTHVYLLRIQLHVLIIDIGIAKDMGCLGVCIIHHGVCTGIYYRRINAVLP